MKKLLCLFILLATQAFGQFGPSYSDLIKTDFIPEFNQWHEGEQRILVRTTIKEGHSYYWRNGGESGDPMRIDTKLPEGVILKTLDWGAPKFKVFYEQSTYAYVGQRGSWHLLTLDKGEFKGDVKLELKNNFQVCDKANCYSPQELDFTTTLMGGDQNIKNPAFEEANSKASHYLAQVLPKDFDLQVKSSDKGFELSLHKPADVDKLYFFNQSDALAAFNQKWTIEADRSIINFTWNKYFSGEKPKLLKGLLVAYKGEDFQAYAIDSSRESKVEVSVESTQTMGNQELEIVESSEAKGESTGFWLTVGFMFIGGLILNLMPCVFPVLALKIQSFINQSQEGKGSAKAHGFAYSGGVLASFWILSAVIIILKKSNPGLTWGFQLQSPGFVLIMTFLLFIVGLNFFGLFEMGVSLTSAGQKVKKDGLGGSFMSGVLATLVATPCAGPFLGPALASTFGMDVLPLLVSFSAMGLGLSLPYLILGVKPELLKFLPRPGAWMEKFKQSMGFLMMLATIYFFWSLSTMIGVDWSARVLAGMTCVAIGLWIYGSWGTPWMTKKVRLIAVSLALIIGGAGTTVAYDAIQPYESSIFYRPNPENVWHHYDAEYVEKLEAENKPYFIDFTAAWCGICQYNKKVAINREAVQKAFLDKGVTLVEGDMTNEDPKLSAALKKYGRSAVPVYVFYDGKNDWKVLPSTLSEGLLLDEISTIE